MKIKTIRLAEKKDWVNVAECSCGWKCEYRKYNNELDSHHKTDCPDKGTCGAFGNSKSYRKIDKKLKTLVGANGEIYIIELV